MFTKQIFKLTVALLAVLAFQCTDADQQGDVAGSPIDSYRFKYDPSNAMPDHLAYLALMQNLVLADKEVGREKNIAHIQSHLSLDREHAEHFFEFIQHSYDKMIDTNRTVTNRMLCSGSRPKYEMNKAYAIVDVLDDIKETNLRKYYRHVLIEFNGTTAGELNKWLAVIKTGKSPHKYDQQKLLKHHNPTVEQVVSSACGLLASS